PPLIRWPSPGKMPAACKPASVPMERITTARNPATTAQILRPTFFPCPDSRMSECSSSIRLFIVRWACDGNPEPSIYQFLASWEQHSRTFEIHGVHDKKVISHAALRSVLRFQKS